MENLYKVNASVQSSVMFLSAAMLIFAGLAPDADIDCEKVATALSKAGYDTILQAMGNHPKVKNVYADLAKSAAAMDEKTEDEQAKWYTATVNTLASEMLQALLGFTGVRVAVDEGHRTHLQALIKPQIKNQFGLEDGDTVETAREKMREWLDRENAKSA